MFKLWVNFPLSSIVKVLLLFNIIRAHWRWKPTGNLNYFFLCFPTITCGLFSTVFRSNISTIFWKLSKILWISLETEYCICHNVDNIPKLTKNTVDIATLNFLCFQKLPADYFQLCFVPIFRQYSENYQKYCGYRWKQNIVFATILTIFWK